MEAVILAGGKGTRLQPLTAEIPKPLVTVGDRPIVEILLRGLKRAGVSKVHLAVNHLAPLIMATVGDGRKFDLEVAYSHESTPLSTVGPIKLIAGLPETFLVANGDVLTDLDFRELYEHHLRSQARVTVATHSRHSRIDYGVLEVDRDGRMVGFQEKPARELIVSMGVYVFSRSVLDLVPDGQPFGFDDLMYLMLRRKEPVHTLPYSGYWLDVGRPEDYEQAQRDIEFIRGLV